MSTATQPVDGTIAAPATLARNAALVAEFFLLFALLPIALYSRWLPLAPMPVLWLAALLCAGHLLRDKSFDRRRLWNAAAFHRHGAAVVEMFALAAIVIGALVYTLAPARFLLLPQRRPALWLALLLFYPVLSVYPQNIVYRAFFFHRYQPLFTSERLMIFTSAAVFGFVHIIFGNVLAVVLTFVGGLFFAWRYRASDSLFTSALEHALYGCFMFTIGLGNYFYGATYR